MDKGNATQMKQLTIFILVGFFNTFLGYVIIFSMMYLAGLSPLSSNAIGYAAGLLISYVLHRTYTFKSKQARTGEFFRFIVVFFIAYGINAVTLIVLVETFLVHEGVSQVMAGVAYVGSTFLMQKFLVFKKFKTPQ